MEKRRCLLLSSWTGGETGRTAAPSGEVLVMAGGSAAIEGDRNSAADGLRGICSLTLPSSRVGLPVDSGDRKLCRRLVKSASLV
jgi:hypothetical protein